MFKASELLFQPSVANSQNSRKNPSFMWIPTLKETSGQIIVTSAEVTLNDGLVRESPPQNPTV